MLDQMNHEHGSEITYYAAFVLVCLYARHRQQPSKPLELTPMHLQPFTFFQAAKDYPGALAMFDAVLGAYQGDLG
nr:hypothetical protein [uncultured bacterium]